MKAAGRSVRLATRRRHPVTQSPMPHRQNSAGRQHIPKMRHSVTNWRECEGGLRRRGSLTMWITDKAIAKNALSQSTQGLTLTPPHERLIFSRISVLVQISDWLDVITMQQ